MKKVFIVLGIYTFIIFICCMAETFIYRTIPPLIQTSVSDYRIMRGLGWFLMLLPTIFLSGFTVACAVLWKANSNNSKSRFSAAMIDRYRTVMFTSLVFVALLSFNEEIFRPIVKGQISSLENAPLELDNDLENVNRFLADGSYEIAYMYAKRAITIAPKDEKAAAIFKRASDEFEKWKSQNIRTDGFSASDFDDRPLYVKDHSYTIPELMEMSRSAADEKSWFKSHYWASLAIDACKGVNTNLQEANQLATTAWNELKQPEEQADSEEYRIHRRKWAGYTAYAKEEPDYLTAY
ncbi:MAG: hypothetical protein IJU95_02980, partial [Treponema sp.]|nr:hypothetical protein [Treponema sp.]